MPGILYTIEFLEETCKPMCLSIEAKEAFFKYLEHAGNEYLSLKKSNSNRIQKNQQQEIFNNFKNLLAGVNQKHQEIINDNAMSAKFYNALRIELSKDIEPQIKEMFNPYINSGGIVPSFFSKFLDVLILASENAINQNVGNDRTDISSKILAYWLASIRNKWPKESTVSFALGTHLKEAGGYKSKSADILYNLILGIVPEIEKKDVITAMRKVINKKNQTPAYSFLN